MKVCIFNAHYGGHIKMIKGNSPIIFIQGDTFVYQVSFPEKSFETIDKVVFSCDALDIEQEMVKDSENEKFIYTFLSSITALWVPLQTTFDIIVDFTDGAQETQTGIPLIIKKRFNTAGNPQPPTTTVYWSQIVDVPTAVQIITSSATLTGEDDYNVDKLNHIKFSENGVYDLDEQFQLVAALEDEMVFATNEEVDSLFDE